MTVRSRRHLFGLMIALIAGGCAVPMGSSQLETPGTRVWSGRMALDLETDPPQTFSASFELKGTVNRGELTLSTPLGNVLALIQWSPGEARLRVGGDLEAFESVESLTRQVTGAALPLGALFGWLAPHVAAADWVKALGDGFVKLIKMAIAPIIFCTVVSGVAHIEDARKVGVVRVHARVNYCHSNPGPVAGGPGLFEACVVESPLRVPVWVVAG